ncbi:hypothetical protein G6F60_013605 [Rhizopus arrhizus]|nr:hypothetical protein G6F60_013605 [Rhizopus arrhizus]
MVSAWPLTMACAACLSMTTGLAPPTIIDALSLGLIPSEGVGRQHAVDVGHLQSGVVQRALGGLGVEAQARHVGNLADVRFAYADDGDSVL